MWFAQKWAKRASLGMNSLCAHIWAMTPEYDTVKTALKNLSPINDSSERTLALAIRLNTNITRDEESFQELVQVVEAHRIIVLDL